MKILGIGNALTDILVNLSNDTTLGELELKKGGMFLLEEAQRITYENFMKQLPKTLKAGGSAANTIHGIAKLNSKCGFIGKIGEDEIGNQYLADMVASGIESHLIRSSSPSGRCNVLVSPDSERTMATYLGAASELETTDIKEDIIASYDIAHIEGYLVFNNELAKVIVKKCKEQKLLVSLDLASFTVVDINKECLGELLKYTDIVFANEEEAKSFTGKEPKEAVEELGKICKIAVVKEGPKGVYIKTDIETIHLEAFPAVPVDKTGAGDLFASGFLFGISKGLNMVKCGQIGSLLASKVIEEMGPKISDNVWIEIRKEVERIIERP